MMTEYFPNTTFFELSAPLQNFYQQHGYVPVRSLDGAECYAPAYAHSAPITTRNDRKVARDEIIYQTRVRRNKLVPRESYDFQELLRCVEVIDDLQDDEGRMYTMLTEYAGIVDVEVLSTRYVIHFESAFRRYVLDKLAEYMIPHTPCTDGHTVIVHRLIKQPRKRKSF